MNGLLAPRKLLGGVLGQMAGAIPAAPPPPKALGAFDTGFDAGFTPADDGAFSAPPAKFVNANQPAAAWDATPPVGPPKLKPIDLLGAFPYPGQVQQPAMGGTYNVGGDWAGVERWSSQIAQAAAKYGVPINLVKAVMRLESNGDPNAAGAPGVWGPMQVYGDVWGDGPWMHDANANIDKGVQILRQFYDENGQDWGAALQHYHGIGWDGYNTDTQYRDIVNDYWSQLNRYGTGPGAGVGSGIAGGTGGQGSTTSWSSLFSPQAQVYDWGEFNVPSSNGLYGYSTEYGLNGTNHTGLDVAMDPGTPMRAAFSGHVVCAGTNWGTGEDPCGAFNCQGFCPNGSAGRIEIMSDDGNTVLIYGHSSGSNVRPGQVVNAGDILGTSGGEVSGHVHLEARVRDPNQPSGWRIVDPRTVLGGSFAGYVGQPYGGYAQTPGSFGRSLTQFAQNWRP